MEKIKVPELDVLFNDVRQYRNSHEFEELFNFIRCFPNMAPYNALLVHIQKPGSQFVASAREWLWLYGRNVKAGARPLVILRMFGPVSFVFELNDTEGKPFPEPLENPFRVKGTVSANIHKKLIFNMECDSIRLLLENQGTGRAGSIERAHGNIMYMITKGKTDYLVNVLYEMVVNRNMKPEEQFVTILHELGHLYCGHIPQKEAKWLPKRNQIDMYSMEFEAECVCWLICERMGIENPSAEYLSGYLKNNVEIPEISIDAVMKATHTIEMLIRSDSSPRKEIIIQKTTR